AGFGGSGGSELGDAEVRGTQPAEQRRRIRGGEPSGDELADGGESRPQGQAEGHAPIRREAAHGRPVGSGGGVVPMFPPGRTDYRRWAELVAGGLDPTLMPAIESGDAVVAPRNAAPASDLLRIGGN